jgi:hypothetical protein
MPSDPLPGPCRLCRGATEFVFQKTILGRHHVHYFTCSNCGSQQTQPPTWLDEAYSFPGLHIDVGAPTRSIKNWLAAATLLDAMKIALPAQCVDFGGGSGLFTGLMRSSGWDFRTCDRFATPLFSSYYTLESLTDIAPLIITAFEMFEHLPEPRETLSLLFSRGASVILFTTWLVDGQNQDWIYYLPECGQHVFFYSLKGIEDIASAHGYRLCVSQYFYILYAPNRLSPLQVHAVEDFSLNAIARVKARIPELIAHVIMGNSHIDADFEASSAIFRAMLEASVPERAQEFGPAL